MEPHFDWVLIDLNRRPELTNKKDKRMESQIEVLWEQLLDRMDKEVRQRVKDGDEETPRITSLQWDGTDWKMLFE